jgi:CBS domain-containing protein
MRAARLRLVEEANKGSAARKRSTTKAPSSAAKAASATEGPREPPSTERRVKAKPARARANTSASASKRACAVADVMRTPVVCCRLDDTLHRAAQLMWEHDVGALVVVDEENRARHVITDRDICMGAYTQGVPLWASSVQSVQPRRLVACSPDAGLEEAMRLMQEHGVRRVPVTDSEGSVIGMLGLGDLTREATAAAPKGRARGLTTAELARTFAAAYADLGVPEGRGLES